MQRQRRHSKISVPSREIPACLRRTDRIPVRVTRAYQLLEKELTSLFSYEALIKEIASRRGKKLLVVERDMPVGIAGYIVALKDVDLICVRKGLDPFQARAVILHECGHLVCKHMPRYSNGENTPTYAEFIQTPSMSYARCRKTGVGYRTKREYEAEMMALLLCNAIDKYENTPGIVARILYGK